VYYNNGLTLSDKSSNSVESTANDGLVINDVNEYIFDGTTYITATNTIDDSNPIQTVSFFIKKDSTTQTGWGGYVSNDGSATGGFIGYSGSSNKERVYIHSNDDTSIYIYDFATALDTDLHNIVVVLDGTDAYTYLDGIEIDKTAFPHYWKQTSQILEIGRSSTNYFAGGSISNVAIYDRALSSSEVTALYNAGGNPIPGPVTDAYFEKAFTDVQTSNITFSASNNYQEILSASITNQDQTASGYIDVTVQMTSSKEMAVTCKVEVNNVEIVSASRTNLAGTFGSLDILSDDIEFIEGESYDLSLQCKKTGPGRITILDSVGVAHYIPNNMQYGFHDLSVTGQTYSDEVLDSNLLTASYTGFAVVDWANQITNNQGTTQTASSYIKLDGVKICGDYSRGIDAGATGSVGSSCSFPVVKDTTYTLSMFMTATNVDVIHKGHSKKKIFSSYAGNEVINLYSTFGT